jgi:hypothetical protein
MSSEATRDCKPIAEVPEAVVSIDDQSNRRGHRISFTNSASLDANLEVKSESESVSDATTTGELVKLHELENTICETLA